MNNDLPIYHGSSMRGVFRTGERLLMESALWDEIAPGDIVAFESGDRQIVHRVIMKSAATAVTMGDSNLEPDPGVLRATDQICLVTGAMRLNGKVRHTSRGKSGMRQFIFNQLRMRMRIRFSRLLSALSWVLFWRLKTNFVQNFGDRQVYYFYRIPVAFQKNGGPVVYMKWYKRIFFKAVELKK